MTSCAFCRHTHSVGDVQKGYSREMAHGGLIRFEVNAKRSRSRLPPLDPKGQVGGYHVKSMTATKRREKLLQHIRKTGRALPVFRRLNQIAIYFRKKQPELAARLIKDRDWIKRRFYKTKYWPKP